MKTFTAVLGLAAAFMFAPPAVAQQDSTLWEVEEPGKWIRLIDRHTPPITVKPDPAANGHFCYPLISGASKQVSAVADKGQLYWARPPRVKPEWLGATIHGIGYKQILINWNHPGNASDYWKAMTMAHEGLHAYFGPEPFTYLGDQYTSKNVYVNGDSISEGEALIREIIEDCFEPEEEEEEKPECDAGADCGGNQPPEPVCEEKQVSENYTEYELQDRTAEVCYNYRTFGGTQISTFCVDISFKVYVSVEKTRMVTKTVCQN